MYGNSFLSVDVSPRSLLDRKEMKRMIPVRLKTFILGLAALTFISSPNLSQACLHSSKKFKGSILNEGYEGLIFHTNGREELILNVKAGFSTKASSDTEIGWVLALPAVPDHYDAKIDSRVFQEASLLVHKFGPNKDGDPSGTLTFGGPSKRAPIRVLKFDVGPYEIHQIETLGDDAVKAMNDWFQKNNFATKDPKDMAFFIKRRYTFLCIKVKPGGQSKSGFNSDAALSPLRVSFAADKPFFPLKFSSHGGVFPLSLYLFTTKPIDWVKSAESTKQLGWSSTKNIASHPRMNYEMKSVMLKGQLAKLYRKIAVQRKEFRGSKLLFVNHIRAYNLNSRNNPISKWKKDLWFSLNSDPHRAKVRKYMRAVLLSPKKAKSYKKKILNMGVKAKACLNEVSNTSSNKAARDLADELLGELGS